MAIRFDTAAYLAHYENVILKPSITVWNRLELSPFSDDLTRSLATEIRDPLWMLARQWQTGEFQGEDAGAPLTARVAWEDSPLTTLIAPPLDTQVPLGDEAPLEAAVEAEPIEDHLKLALRLGELWLRSLVGDAELLAVAPWFRDRFKPDSPPDGALANLAAARAVANVARTDWLRLAARRGQVDGLALLGWLRAGLPDGPPELSAEAQQRLQTFGARFLAAHDAQFVRPAPDGILQRSRFEYRFGLAPNDAADAGLLAEEHDGTHLDWRSFDRTGPDRAAHGDLKGKTFLPQPVSFPGMPVNRWWEFEDRRIDLGSVMAGRTGLSKMLLVEFGLLYGNDWFVLPVPVPSGSLARVAGVVVTDGFAISTLIPSDDALLEGEAENASTLFTLTGPDGILARTSLLAVPPSAMSPMEGAPLDRLLLLRDEMANMAWAVEQIVPDGLGAGMDARAAADRTRTQLRDPKAERDDADTWASEAVIRWRLRTQVPDSWIPLVPARQREGIVFQQGAMPWSAAPFAQAKILPRTALLGRTAAQLPFLIEEEEVPRSGAVVERAFARVRWHDGRTCVWLGRSKRNGRGPGSSGLAFDGLVERPTPEA